MIPRLGDGNLAKHREDKKNCAFFMIPRLGDGNGSKEPTTAQKDIRLFFMIPRLGDVFVLC